MPQLPKQGRRVARLQMSFFQARYLIRQPEGHGWVRFERSPRGDERRPKQTSALKARSLLFRNPRGAVEGLRMHTKPNSRGIDG